MDQNKLILAKQTKGLSFYKFPYLEILIGVVPANAINDMWQLWIAYIRDTETAGLVLQVLVDRGRSAGL